MTSGPSTVASSTRSHAPSTWVRRTESPGAAKTGSGTSTAATPCGAFGNEERSKFFSSVNSQPATPLCVGSSRVFQSANGAFHLELDEAVHLDRVLHRQLLDDRLDEAVDDELRRLLLGQPVGL